MIYIDDCGSRVKYQWIYSYIKRIFKKEKGSASQIMLRNNNNQKKNESQKNIQTSNFLTFTTKTHSSPM